MPNKGVCFEVKRNAISLDYTKLNKFAQTVGMDNSYVVSYTYIEDEHIVPACLI